GPLPLLQSAERRRTVETLDALLDKAATALIRCAPPPRYHRHHPRTVKGQPSNRSGLRADVVRTLLRCFRERLGAPHRSHVATIATFVSGVETDEDYVKKVDVRTKSNKTG